MVHSRIRLQTAPSHYVRLAKYLVGAANCDFDHREAIEEWLRVKFRCNDALAVNQCRVGIYAAIKAALKLCPGRRKVILSPYTLFEVINMAIYAGAEPVFVDVIPDEPFVSLEAIEQLADDETAAVVLTHYHQPVPDTSRIAEFCRSRGILLIEDCAVSLLAEVDGQAVGTIGDVGCLSFGLFKVVNAFYGGAVVARNHELFQEIVSIVSAFPEENRQRLFKRGLYALTLDILTNPLMFSALTFPIMRAAQNRNGKWVSKFTRVDSDPKVGSHYPNELRKRPTEVQLELIWRGLQDAAAQRTLRERRARRYQAAFEDLPVKLPALPNNSVGSWTEFPVVTKDHDALFNHLTEAGRDVRFNYYLNCADMPIYKDIYRDCANARRLMQDTLMLPLYLRYPDQEMDKNIESIRRFYGRS